MAHTLRPRRVSSHVIAISGDGNHYLISSLCGRSDVLVITIEARTGSLLHSHKEGVDIFHTNADAIDSVRQRCEIKSTIDVAAILGYIRTRCFGYLIVATKVLPNGLLPGDHAIYTIEESRWIRIAFKYPHPIDPVEEKNLETLKDLNLNQKHIYCETYDLTRPFPSLHQPHVNFRREFCVNNWVALPFSRIGLRQFCPVLIQGSIMHCHFAPDESNQARLTLIARRSLSNPGVRSSSCGLNEHGGCANDWEFEQIVWIVQESIKWNAYVWRQGSAPLWWRLETRNTQHGSQDVIVLRQRPSEKSDKYFQRLVSRYQNKAVACVNLLRPGEHVLAENLKSSIKSLRESEHMPLSLIDFDWNEIYLRQGLDSSATRFWDQISPILKNGGVSSGYFSFCEGLGEFEDSQELPFFYNNGDNYLLHASHSSQDTIVRLVCADGLECSLPCSLFLSSQLLYYQLHQFHFFKSTQRSTEGRGDEDHPWPSLTMKLSDLANILPYPASHLLHDFYESAFQISTWSFYGYEKAIPSWLSKYLSLVSPDAEAEVSEMEQESSTSNRKSTVRPITGRDANSLQWEMFLGINREKHLPSSSISFPNLVSNENAWCLNPVGNNGKLDRRPHNKAGIFSDDNMSLTFADGLAVCEVIIYLQQPCYLSEIMLIVQNGSANSSFPRAMDLFVGLYLDNMQIIYQETPLPQSNDGSQLYFTIPSKVVREHHDLQQFSFDGYGTNLAPLSRVIQFRFYKSPGSLSITIGKIEAFGYTVQPSNSPAKDEVVLLHPRTQKKVAAIVHILNSFQSPGADGPVNSPLELLSDLSHVVDEDTDGVDVALIGHNQRDPLASPSRGFLVDLPDPTTDDRLPGSHHHPDIVDEDMDAIRPRRASFDSPTTAMNSLTPIGSRTMSMAKARRAKDSVFYTGSMSIVSPLSSRILDDSAESAPRRKSFDSHDLVSALGAEPQSITSMITSPVRRKITRSPSVVATGHRGFLERKPTKRDSKGAQSLEADYIGALCLKLGIDVPPLPLKTTTSGQFKNTKSSSTRKDSFANSRQHFRFHPIHARNFGDSVFFNYEQIAGLYRQLSMFDAFDLERLRLDSEISPQERDNILHRLGLRIDLLDINRHIIPFDEKKLTLFHNKGQTFKYKSKCAECQSWLFPGFSRPQCRYCYQYYCSSCMSSDLLQMIHFKSLDYRLSQRYDLCRKCINLVARQNRQAAEIVQYADRKKLLQGDAIIDSSYQKLTIVMNMTSVSQPLNKTAIDDADLLSFGEFPRAGILYDVPTMPGSPPVESILFPKELAQFDQFWRAPSSEKSITLTICLSDVCTLHKIRILVDALGYTSLDAPVLSIYTSFHISNDELFEHRGDWSVGGGNREVSPLSSLDFDFSTPVTCRIVKIRISLPLSQDAGQEGIFVHMGFLRFYGTYFELSPHRPVQKQTSRKTIERTPSASGNELKVQPPRNIYADRVLEFSIEEGVIHGFTIDLQQGFSNPLTQVKLMRVFLISRDITPQVWDAGVYVIPRTRNCTALKYSIPEIPGQRWAVVSFEMLASYGEEKFVPFRIRLW
eukprot:TRINITY_DN6623_c0_g1_i1.p1 TRINITY_DN6623_c0_g1~~TRINITY_DN6623_c0_g1_i1.p1  ORF type:complete len:1554 (+),score=313.59 TRINITY_DN6623_c0_g1_i1:61-4722(+)